MPDLPIVKVKNLTPGTEARGAQSRAKDKDRGEVRAGQGVRL